MADRDFINAFKQKKEEFRKRIEDGSIKISEGRGRSARSSERLLDWFEKWLEGELPEQPQRLAEPAMPFDEFLSRVFELSVKKLAAIDPELGKVLSSQAQGVNNTWKFYSKSWKCLYIYEDSEVFYRIGKTTPRKGPNKGSELLVIELVMDGRKKQAFMPMLKFKQEIEEKIGSPLERELPRVEATGKYRFKLFLPYELAHNGHTEAVAGKLCDLIAVTRPILNDLGIK